MINDPLPEYFVPIEETGDRTVAVPLHDARRSSPSSDRLFIGLARILDSSLIAICLLIPVLAYTKTWPNHYTVMLLLAIATYSVCASLLNIYRPWPGESMSRQFFRIVFVWAVTLFVLLATAYLTKTSALFSRASLTPWVIVTPFVLSGWRIVVLQVLARRRSSETNRRNVVVWGSGYVAKHLAATIQRSPSLGLRLVGHVMPAESQCSDARLEVNTMQSALSSHYDIDDLYRLAKRGEISIIYIVLETTPRADLFALLDRLADTNVSIYMVPDLLTRSLLQGHWSSLEGIPLVSVFDTPFWGADGWLKRMQDIVLSSLILVVIAIPMLVIAILIKATSPGPVLFKQTRYGMSGHPIRVLKFRTMTVCEDGDQVRQTTVNDCRVTPLGKFLRRTSLDELPQFINVLRGDMSIVGPRPHAVVHNEFYRSRINGYTLRHKVRPGITGWAQIHGWRGETEEIEKMEMRVKHDLWYIRNWNTWLDLKIIALTIVGGFSGKNAY
jgi:putative colanic acid biosysnthesis UDP-glucose lipid carrier transferase